MTRRWCSGAERNVRSLMTIGATDIVEFFVSVPQEAQQKKSMHGGTLLTSSPLQFEDKSDNRNSM